MISVFGSKVGVEELEEIRTSLQNQWLGIGKKCAQFEEELASRLGLSNFVMVNSGSNGLLLAIYLLGLKPGAEVIVPSFTWIACGHAVVLNGCRPVFCDVDWNTQNLTFETIEPRITRKTKAIMVVHYAGKPVSLDPLRSLKLPVIEDAAHAVDSKIGEQYCGSFGEIGVYSFDAVKNISIGEAGGITCRNPEWAEKARNLRYCGIAKSGFESTAAKSRWWEYEVAGYFPKVIPGDIAASIGLAQMKKLNDHQACRREIWERYQKEFANLGWFLRPLDPGLEEQHSYFTYLIRLTNGKRDDLAKYLFESGIYTTLRFHPLHLNKIYGSRVKLPNAERLSETALNLPIHPALSEEDVSKVIDRIKTFGQTYC